jgi:hypothetical protein
VRSFALPALAAAIVLTGCAGASAGAGSAGPPLKLDARKTGPGITVRDLMSRLYLYADDSMQGRAFGLAGNARATDYIAAEAARMKLEPAGENGTYFQTVPVALRLISENASLSVNGRKLAIWDEWSPRDQLNGSRLLTGVPVVYGGVWFDSLSRLGPEAAAGKVVVFAGARGPDGTPLWELNRAQATAAYRRAAAVIIGILDATPPDTRAFYTQPTARIGAVEASDTARVPAFIYVTSGVLREMVGADPAAVAPGTALPPLEGGVAFTNSLPEAPSRNVIAVLRGSDPSVRNQFVAIGAHNDHIGFGQPVDHDSLRAYNTVMRPGGVEGDDGRQPTAAETARIRAILDSLRAINPPRLDSIGNGADDDGSGTVTVLELAEMMSRLKERPRRSILFVWHTGEEAGLLGSDWFTRNPTVARDSIVAQLNIDMVGRGGAEDIANGGPNYLQLIGSRRLSSELGAIIERRNTRNGHDFVFDYQYDANGHPQQFYCRSDHYMYARYGIPIVFFTTGGHRDYHMVTDEPQYIDYRKLRRVALLIGDIAMHVANMANRPVVDGPKPDPNGQCVQ